MKAYEEQYTGPAGSPQAHGQPAPGDTQPPRYADWISYAVAVTQHPLPSRPEFVETSKL